MTYVPTVQIAQNSFVRFATGQLHPIDAIVKNNGSIPRQLNPKHIEHTISLFVILKSLYKHNVIHFINCLAREKFASEAGAHHNGTAERI